jgi:hypothetical protein
MPIMSKPSWGDSPLVTELMRRASQLGLDDPSSVMTPPGMGIATAAAQPVAAAIPETYSAAKTLMHPGAEAVMNRLSTAAQPTFNAMKDAGSFAGDRTVGGLRSLLSRAVAPASEASSRMAPDFTPVGGEGLYNTGKAMLSKVMDPVEAAYHRILLSGGR